MVVQLSATLLCSPQILKIFLLWNHPSITKYQKCIKCLKPFFDSYTLQHYQVFICQPIAINTALTIIKMRLFLFPKMRLHTSAICLPSLEAVLQDTDHSVLSKIFTDSYEIGGLSYRLNLKWGQQRMCCSQNHRIFEIGRDVLEIV